MTPIVNPMMFYWLSIVDEVDLALTLTFGITFVIALCIGLFMIFEDVRDDMYIGRMFKLTTIIAIISCIGMIAVPSEDTLLKIFVAQNVTYENVEYVKDSANDLVDYIIEKVDELKDGEAND